MYKLMQFAVLIPELVTVCTLNWNYRILELFLEQFKLLLKKMLHI